MFKITIEETRTVVKTVGKEWAIVDQVPITDGGEVLKNVMGYTPLIEKPVPETKEIYAQTVEELDLHAVIRAINKL